MTSSSRGSGSPTDACPIDELVGKLARVGHEKREAVNAQDFAKAAELRGVERELQQEWHARGGPRPGCHRIRIDFPNGANYVSEAPTLAEAMEPYAHDLSGELAIIDESVVLIAKALNLISRRYAVRDANAK